MVHFVGAGPGAPDLITQRGAALLQAADCIIYAGSLVNPALLGLARADCAIYNSAEMTLEQVAAVMKENEAAHKDTVRLHTGDPCLYGAIREQMDLLDAWGIAYDDTPGVSSFCGAAAALNAEYTLPGVSQTVIITRMEGRTPVPEGEHLAALAAHGATMVIFLSIGLIDKVQAVLLQGAYTAATPAAVVYKATWPEEKILRCTVGTLAAQTQAAGITKTALIGELIVLVLYCISWTKIDSVGITASCMGLRQNYQISDITSVRTLFGIFVFIHGNSGTRRIIVDDPKKVQGILESMIYRV